MSTKPIVYRAKAKASKSGKAVVSQTLTGTGADRTVIAEGEDFEEARQQLLEKLAAELERKAEVVKEREARRAKASK